MISASSSPSSADRVDETSGPFSQQKVTRLLWKRGEMTFLSLQKVPGQEDLRGPLLDLPGSHCSERRRRRGWMWAFHLNQCEECV